jgi:serine/threonine-protein kinase
MVDARSDLFSAGVLMYYLLTNQPFYGGDSTLNQLMRAAVGPATVQIQQIEQLPPVAAKILVRALATDPANRYQSAAEFARDLVPHATGAKARVTELMTRLFPEDTRRRSGG